MAWKKYMFLFIVFFSVFLLSSSHLYAGEAELINLLKKKGIITQQEAEQLLQEVRSETQKEKEDVKKNIATEIKADIKKDVAKGEFLPSFLKGFKFGAQIFTEWNSVNRFDGYAPTSTTAPGKNSNAFVLNRGQFTLSKDINDWLGMNITADLFYTTDTTNDATNGAELRLKAAYANVKFYGTDTMVGMVPTPSDGYDNSIWAYRVQGKNLLDDLGILSTYDLGIANQGVFGGYMDDEYLKFASKPFAGKWGGYMIGLYNGAGFTTTTGEGNENKVISGLIYVRPFPNIPILKGFQLAYFGAYGKSNKLSTVPGQTNNYPNFEVNIGQVSLLYRYFAVMGQYYWGQGAATGTEDYKRVGYLAEGFIRIPGVEKLRAFAKIYSYDPNADTANNDYRVYVAGLSYDVTPELMPFIAWERRDNERNVAAGTTSANIDYNKYQIGVQLKF